MRDFIGKQLTAVIDVHCKNYKRRRCGLVYAQKMVVAKII